MTSWTLRLPQLTARVNELLGNWARAAKLKKRDRRLVALAWLEAGGVPATGRRRVDVEITLTPRQRGTDPDAFFKSLLDSLVACGALFDDAAAWCQLGEVTFTRGDAPAMRVTVSDVAGTGACPTCGHVISEAV